MIMRVRVKPGSSQEKVELEGEVLTVWIKSKPIEGAANRELLRILKKVFGDARLVGGAKSRVKRVEIPVTAAEVEEILRR